MASQAFQNTPAWFQRVWHLQMGRELAGEECDFEPLPEDFDEDLSELHSDESEHDHIPDCECGEDVSDCDCGAMDHLNGAMEMDADSDTEHYEGWNKLRIQYKKAIAEELAPHIEYHTEREAEVREASLQLLRNVSRGIKAQELKLAPASFSLYSPEYINSIAPGSVLPSVPCVKFWPMHEFGNMRTCGELSIELGTDRAVYELEPFKTPTRGRMAYVDIGVKGKSQRISVMFVSNKVVKVIISQPLIYPKDYKNPRTTAPEFIKFYGIRDGEEIRKKHEAANPRPKKRERSPRESWFEMNHPMGWWADQEWEYNPERQLRRLGF